MVHESLLLKVALITLARWAARSPLYYMVLHSDPDPFTGELFQVPQRADGHRAANILLALRFLHKSRGQ